jgi:hypothetical protein
MGSCFERAPAGWILTLPCNPFARPYPCLTALPVVRSCNARGAIL